MIPCTHAHSRYRFSVRSEFEYCEASATERLCKSFVYVRHKNALLDDIDFRLNDIGIGGYASFLPYYHALN